MKSKVSLLVAILLLVSTTMVFAAGGKEKAAPAVKAPAAFSGVLADFTEDSLTVIYENTAFTMAITPATVVKRVDQVMDWMMAARKGLLVAIENDGTKVTAVTLPFYGLEAQGRPIPFATAIGLEDVRINKTDSSLVTATEAKDSQGRVVSRVFFREVAAEEDTAWSRPDAKTVMLGNLHIVAGSMKVAFNGKDLKVVDSVNGAGAFAAPAGSSVLLDLANGIYTLKFDVEIGANYADAAKALNISFKKKMYEQTTIETTFLDVDPAVVVELNGKRTTLLDAMTMGNYWLIRCNPEGKMIHIDAYLVEMPVEVVSLVGDALTVKTLYGQQTLKLSPGVTLSKADGSMASASDFVAGSTVLVTTEPADEYNVIFAVRTK